MGIQAPRLYRKETGVFFVRVLIDPVHLGATSKTAKRPNKRELKRSLRTKNPKVARSISSYLNALVESVTTEHRGDVVNQFFAHTISTWTLPGGISCEDDDDQARQLQRRRSALKSEVVAVGFGSSSDGQLQRPTA